MLFEQHKDRSLLSGFTDNYEKIEIPADAADVNTIFPVRLGALNGDGESVLAEAFVPKFNHEA